MPDNFYMIMNIDIINLDSLLWSIYILFNIMITIESTEENIFHSTEFNLQLIIYN